LSTRLPPTAIWSLPSPCNVVGTDLFRIAETGVRRIANPIIFRGKIHFALDCCRRAIRNTT
jgi:hypothetical protein